ncbi:MAG: nickel pincer cofactor biosynthesis protein LarC [Deltaproteobacteria bacterium]|nr:nickel pincer cofactor biosynthesis protein LarC [Deltaproteobacteria bacterium]
MIIAYFDCFSGISGDMVLGAWLDLGLPRKLLRSTLAALDLPPFRLTVRRGERGGLSGLRVEVRGKKKDPFPRHYGELQKLLQKSGLDPAVREKALTGLRYLAEVEARIHNLSVDSVHFHEIGALDTIVDLVGAALGFHYFQVDEVQASPLPAGRGWVQSQHGPLPLPAPAALALLQGAALVPSASDRELVTPTGAAILKTWARVFGPPPVMTLKAVGYGLGLQELADRPNALRLWLGENAAPAATEKILVLETNVDDMNPQWYDYLLERLFQAGALDCLLLPCQMKKNRPGTLLQVLCRPADSPVLSGLLLAETTTLGVRFQEAGRWVLDRKGRRLATPWGVMGLKEVRRPGRSKNGFRDYSLEYEDLKKAAARERKSLKEMEGLIRGWIERRDSPCRN